MRMIIERPADRHLDEGRLLSELVGLPEPGLVAPAREIRRVIAPHHAAVVAKTVREQEVDGGATEVPGRRAVALGPLARQPHDRLTGTDEIGLLLLAGHGRIGNVRPAMVSNLVAVGHHGFAFPRVAFDREARYEPGAAEAHRAQESEDSTRG